MFSGNHKTVFLLSWLLLTGILTHGQAIYDTLNLREFEVIGLLDSYKESYKKTTLDTIVNRNFEHFDLGQMLAAFSPVFIKSYGKGSISSASFRGTSASHTQVLWNDFAINSPMLGQVDFSYIPQSFFDETELLYGGGSLYRSGGALGGSVLLSTNTESQQKPMLHLSQSAGSFNSFNTAMSLFLKTSGFKSETRAMLQTSKNDFSYYNNGVLPSQWMKQQNSAYLNGGFLQQFSWQINGYQYLNFVSWNQWNNRNIPPIMTNVYKGGNPEEYQNTFFTRNILGYLYQKSNTKIEVKGAWFYEKQHYYLKTTTSNDSAQPVTLIDSRNRTSGFYGKAKWKQQLTDDFTLITGCDIDYNRVNSSNYQSLKTRFSTTLYAGINKRFFKKLSVDMLLREEMVDDVLLPVMPYAGVNYKVFSSKDLFVRASVSRNYHLPTLNDLYWYPGGNPHLNPEDGFETELGINYLEKLSDEVSFTVEITAFYNDISNWIQWKPTDYRYWMPENIAEVISRGVESSLGIHLKYGSWYYNISGFYAYTRTTDESKLSVEKGYNGRQLIYIPVHHGNLFFYVGYKSWNMGWNLLATGSRTTTMNPADSYSNLLPAYILNDIQLGKKWVLKNIDVAVQLKLNNVFDVQYQAVIWRAMPGRNAELVVKFDLR